MTLRVINYARVSTDEQGRNNLSLDEQLKVMRRYAEANGWFIYSEVREQFSGFEYDRPFMDTIRDLAKNREFDALLVLRCDRFARDEGVFIVLERYFKKHGIRLFSVEEGEFTPGTINRYLAAIQRARAQDDAETAKKRMQDARHSYTQAGIPQSQGHPLYGYEKSGKKRETQYVMNERHAEIVRLIFHLYTEEDYTSTQIAAHLNEHKVPSPGARRAMNKGNASGKWIDKTVLRILQNSAYIGKLVGFQHTTVDGKIVPRSKDQHVTIPIPRIIDDKTWEQAQYRLSHARNAWHSRRNKKHDYLLSGMGKCSKCGYSMVGSVSTKDHSKKQYYYYRCSAETKKLFMKRNCNNGVNTEVLENTVWDFIQKLANDPRTTVALYQQEHSETEALFAESKTRIAAINDLLAENDEEKKRLNYMFQKKRCDEQYFDAEHHRLNQERQALEREREKAGKLLLKQEASGRQIEELEEIGREIREAAGHMSFKRKRHILERLRLHITVPPMGRDARHRIYDERTIVIEVLGYATSVRLKRQTPS